MSHVLLESDTLLLFVGKATEPEDELRPGEVRAG
jgi:hypothetical protein